MTLSILDVDDLDVLGAALSYAAGGFYVVPVAAGTKNPGSVVGGSWQHKSSRDPHQIAAWFAGTDHGVALHLGRSGAVAFDVDHPDLLPDVLARILADTQPPAHTSRPRDPRRGHYLFTQPEGRTIGNSTGLLGKGWGEVRGLNGVIVAAPTRHVDADDTADPGAYAWARTGDLPTLPAELADLLNDGTPGLDAATDTQVQAFFDAHTDAHQGSLLKAVTNSMAADITAGGSRHDAAVTATCWAMREAAAGCYPAKTAARQLRDLFTTAIAGERHAETEFAGILAWAVAQTHHSDPQELRAAVTARTQDNDVLNLVPESTTATPTPGPPLARELVHQPAATTTVVLDPMPGERHRGQARMAYRLAEAYAERLMYVHGLGWHYWDGTRWAEAITGQAKRAVLDVLQRALAESLGDKELRADVQKCESAAGLAGVLDIAAALTPFAHQVADLDSDPYLLNVANGTLDLRSATLRPHNPTDRITKVTRGAYRPDETSQAWETFLARVLPDPEVRGFLQRLAGVGLLGIVVEHVLGILTGVGRNGKGVFYGALGHALGEYATVAEPDLFMHREGAHPTGEMDLRGIRWAVVSENDKGRRLAEATMKRLTGGDEIKARRMRQDFVRFTPSHTPLLVTNHLPKVSGDDPALWARMRVVPFEVVIPENERDPHLPERLQLQADGILTWAIAGYRDYVDRGSLDEPTAVKVATTDYQRDNDAMARFVDDRCYISPAAHIQTGDAFDAWAKWAAEEGAEPMSLKAFGLALDRLGYPTAKSNGRRIRRGIGLYADPDNTDQDGDQ